VRVRSHLHRLLGNTESLLDAHLKSLCRCGLVLGPAIALLPLAELFGSHELPHRLIVFVNLSFLAVDDHDRLISKLGELSARDANHMVVDDQEGMRTPVVFGHMQGAVDATHAQLLPQFGTSNGTHATEAFFVMPQTGCSAFSPVTNFIRYLLDLITQVLFHVCIMWSVDRLVNTLTIDLCPEVMSLLLGHVVLVGRCKFRLISHSFHSLLGTVRAAGLVRHTM